jgi:hypothetical protein
MSEFEKLQIQQFLNMGLCDRKECEYKFENEQLEE